MVLSLVSGDEQAKAERRAKAFTLYEQVKAWPYWEEMYLNCVKESPLSYEAFAHAVQAGDSSRRAFAQAMQASQMTREQFAIYLPAFQQFVTLCALYPDVGMLSDGADQIWHAFMLITDRYTAFCEGVIGKPIEQLPCSLYELYGVPPQPDARTSCLSSCVPSSCKGNGGGCSKSDLTRSTADSESIAQAIRVSRAAFLQAYQEVFDAPPDHVIWNQLTH